MDNTAINTNVATDKTPTQRELITELQNLREAAEKAQLQLEDHMLYMKEQLGSTFVCGETTDLWQQGQVVQVRVRHSKKLNRDVPYFSELISAVKPPSQDPSDPDFPKVVVENPTEDIID